MSLPRVLIVGSANADLVTRVPRCPKPGESIIGRDFATIPGGKGANQAVAAVRLGAHASFIGCVGADPLGHMLRDSLHAAGVETMYLDQHPTAPTGVAVIFVADDGQNGIVVTPGANFGVTEANVLALEPIFRGADAVLAQLEIPLDAVVAALTLAKRSGALAVLDAGPAQQVDDALLRAADIVSPNETEAEAMTGVVIRTLDDARTAAERLRARGADRVVLKLGALGAYYLGPDGECHVPAFAIEPVDTVAAGDAFTAALAIAWRTMERPEALRFANAAGALAALKHGAQPSMPARADVEAFLQTGKTLP